MTERRQPFDQRDEADRVRAGRPDGTGPDELPASEGVRSDHAGTSAGTSGTAPAGGTAPPGGNARRPDEQFDPIAEHAPASEVEPPGGQFTAAGGGYGVGSDRGGATWEGTGGASEPDAPGETPTHWLRSEETNDRAEPEEG